MEILLLPVWLVAMIGIALLAVLLFVVLFFVNTWDFLIFGPRADVRNREGTCGVCGKSFVAYLQRRWQLDQYYRWLFQHTHSFSEERRARQHNLA